MNLDLIRVLLDFGLFVLIWLVQLVVYPSFRYFRPKDLLNFHKVYTTRVAIVVMPLMVGQLLIYTYHLVTQHSIFNIIGLGLVALTWTSTFFQFVPLHKKISDENSSETTLIKLIKLNWLRTFIWTALFIASLFHYS